VQISAHRRVDGSREGEEGGRWVAIRLTLVWGHPAQHLFDRWGQKLRAVWGGQEPEGCAHRAGAERGATRGGGAGCGAAAAAAVRAAPARAVPTAHALLPDGPAREDTCMHALTAMVRAPSV
jgi:hypothetical protein